MIDGDVDVEVIGVFITRGIVVLILAIGIFVSQFIPCFVDVQTAASDVSEIQHIRIGLSPVSGGGDHKLARILVQQHFGTLAKGTGGVELGDFLLIGFSVGQLLLDLCHRALAAVTEPGRELFGALLAQVAVLQLPVAQQSDLFAADIAILFAEKSHKFNLQKLKNRLCCAVLWEQNRFGCFLC